MAATSPPSLSLCRGRLPLGGSGTVSCVDPDRQLLADLLDAWTDAAAAVAAPSVDRLGEEVAGDTSAPDAPDGGASGDGNVPPTLRVAARPGVLDDVLDGFHPASRAAGLVEADLLSIVERGGREPNAVVVAGAEAAAIVATPNGHLAVRDEAGDAVRTAYDEVLADADRYRIRTPSRRALYRAYADRCSPEVADDLLRLLDLDPELSRGDPCDQLDRAYAVAARRGAVNYGVRRAAEDSGLASPSTLSTVKADLETVGLIDTEPVSRPVGRPRQRIVPATDELASVPLREVPEVVASSTNHEKE